MEVAPGILARTFTAPVSSHSRLNNSQSSSSTPNTYSIGSRPSRSSETTQDSTAALFALRTSPPPIGAIIEASNNVINRVADKETSLYQQCITLRNRLRKIPGFDEEYYKTDAQAKQAGERSSAVDLLWETFRRGYSLIAIYNALGLPHQLEISKILKTEMKREKDAVYKFIEACHVQLNFPQSECFMVSDLNSDDTTGFVKVVNVVNRVVDMLVQNGTIDAEDPKSAESERQSQRLSQTKKTQRQHIVDELVRTERTYVQHLQMLLAFKKEVELQCLIPGDAIYDIFLNLNKLLDVQTRFLIDVETEDNLEEIEQNWGRLFDLYGEHFTVYVPNIINQKTCEESAVRYFDKLQGIQGSPELRSIVESEHILRSFLLKPFNRLCKYPLLLKDLGKNGALDEERRADIQRGIAAMEKILNSTNAHMAAQEQHKIVQDLKEQVDDWRNHRVEGFGNLLLHGNFQIIKGDGMNTERQYSMYLFEKILLCCKEIGQSKKGKISTKPLPPPTKNGKPKMALKGRIFMANVSQVQYSNKPGKFGAKISSDTQIFWHAGDFIEYFIIKFPTQDIMNQWEAAIAKQRQDIGGQAGPAATSETEFRYMQDHGDIENPYKEDDGDDDLSDYPHSAASNTASNHSLRSRSTTGESITSGTMSRGGKHGPLTLRTQHLHSAVSPQEKYGNSYFSPIADSPASYSSRTSSSSGIMPPGSRQSGPTNGYAEENNRFTAPAAAYSRMSGKESNGYYPVDPRIGRHITPPHQAALSNRMRSASSPDVHTMNSNIRAAGQNAPPMPNMPPHLANSSVNRSQNSSPLHSTNLRASNDASHLARTQTTSPPLMSPASSFGDGLMPSSLRVKVRVPSEGSAMTLVVGLDVTFQALQSKIDAKLQRHTNLSLADGSVKLKYIYDDEFVTIQTDEDVQTAFETWRDQLQGPILPGQANEVELFCHR